MSTNATAKKSPASPTRAVLAEIEAGAGSMAIIAERTGLDHGVVHLVVDRLVASGHLIAQRLQSGCPDGGCGSCPSSSSGRSCGSAIPGASSGPVMLTLGKTRR